ncbi:MAG: EAL domain-containing protein [Proteobacteria bacterium]|nr:EAL domain-containing protein [Pseudomonadota bacterium]
MAHLSNENGRQHGDSARRDSQAAADNSVRQAIAASAIELLRSLAPETLIPKILKRFGQTCSASRVQLYEYKRLPGGALIPALRDTWQAPSVTPAPPMPSAETPAGCDFSQAVPLLESEDIVTVLTRDAEEPLRGFLNSVGAKSVLLTPVFIGKERWGGIIFEDCARERTWSSVEVDTLKLLAEMIGSAIGRARDLQESLDASWVVEHSPVVLYRIGGKPPFPLIYISRTVSRYGYDARDLLASPGLYLEVFHPDDLPGVMSDINGLAAGRIREARRERRVRVADGSYVWFEDRTHGHYGPGGELLEIEGVLVDITERKNAEAKLEHVSLSDPVTGLPNRRAFMIELDHAFAAAHRGGPAFAIHYIDLDRFKDINDVFGHSKGDELLKAVADRLRRLRRRSADVIARFGGDEFVILQSEISDPSDAGALAARLLKAIAEPFTIGNEIHTTASIGIAVYGPDVSGPEELVKQVDLALYRAKDLGRNQFHFHSEALDAATIERVMLGGDLQRALDGDELLLNFQPQVEIATGRIIGFEALARWNHPKYGSIGPTRFIAIAESNGTIHRLGCWVIDAVCHQIVEWRAAGLKPPPIAFNVSAGQLKGTAEFDRELADRLRHWSIEPKAVEIELTETVLMETTRRHRDIINRLYDLGVPIAIDDFGTGYSSLSYLRNYRVNHIKVAQEFIKDIKPDSGDIAIVRAAIGLGRELGIAVIAEGVETKYQLELVRGAGCEFVQGYYFSPPVSAADVADLLRRGGVLSPGTVANRESEARLP